MAAVTVNSPLVSKCMDFCQALASQGQAFHFSLTMGHTFSFSLDTTGKELMSSGFKKKTSPSTQRRNSRRREEFLKKKEQSLSIVDLPVEKAVVSEFPCDQCDYSNASEKGLKQHKRMKHGKSQLDTQLPSSPLLPPESLLQATSYSGAVSKSLTLSPISNKGISRQSQEQFKIKCDHCEAVFNIHRELQNHNHDVHRLPDF